MPHAELQCKYHQDIIRGTKAYKDHIRNETKTEEEMFEGLHSTQACLAFQQPYIRCTKHPDGPKGIIHIYQTDDPSVSKRRWEAAADAVNKAITKEGGARVTCVFNAPDGFSMQSVAGGVNFINAHLNGCKLDPSQ